MMTYIEFETLLLLALVEAADATERGRCDALQVAEAVFPGVRQRWVSDAVQGYERTGYVGPVVRPMDGHILLQITGNGRKAAEAIREQIAAAQRPRPKMGFQSGN